MRGPAPPREIPPPLELECLKALWELGEASVKDVRRDLSASKELAYTTVMTLLDRLVRKGAASRRKSGRFFLYSPVLSRESVRKTAVKELVKGLFGGSLDELLAFLAGELRRETFAAAQSASDGLDTALL
jgi:predicted transcriptional regulator